MKFLISKDLRRNTYLRTLLILYFATLLVFLGVYFGFESFRYGLTPSQIRDTIAGNPGLFIEPKDPIAIFTDLHVTLFLFAIAILTSFSVFVNTDVRESLKLGLLLAASSCALLDAVSVLGVRFLHPALAWAKAAGFFGFELSMITVTILTLTYLARRPHAQAR